MHEEDEADEVPRALPPGFVERLSRRAEIETARTAAYSYTIDRRLDDGRNEALFIAKGSNGAFSLTKNNGPLLVDARWSQAKGFKVAKKAE